MNNLPTITLISSTNHNASAPQPMPLLSHLVANALEGLGVCKKYTGFRYLVDFLRVRLSSRISKPSYCATLDIVAALNRSTRDIVDRDTRHILMSSWKNSTKLRSTIQLNTNQPGAKQILNNLIEYIWQAI